MPGATSVMSISGALRPRIDLALTPMRRVGAAMLGLGAVLPHVPHNPGLPCPLRTLTGIPCPLCGMTTSVKATMHLDLHAAVVANPFGVLAVIAAIVLLLRPKWQVASLPLVLLVVTAATSWLFELHRFHLI